MNSPLNWLGGKSKLRKIIVGMLPEHLCYVEAFCGAAWVFFEKGPSKVEVINDIDSELVNFYSVVKHRWKEFVEAFQWVLVSRELYRKFKHTDVKKLTELERAVRFYYLVKCGYGNVPCYFNFAPGTTRPVSINLGDLKEIIEGVYQRLRRTTIENLSFEKLIPRFDRAHTVFYVDPPYYEVEPYKHKIGKDGHELLAKILKGIKGKFILSYNDHAEVRRLYRGFKFKEVNVMYSVSKAQSGRKTYGELLIRNY